MRVVRLVGWAGLGQKMLYDTFKQGIRQAGKNEK